MVDPRGRSVPHPGAHRLSHPAICWHPSRLSPPGTGTGDRRLARQRAAKLLFLGSRGYLHQRQQESPVLRWLNAAHLLCPDLRGLVAKTVGVPRLVDEALATKREHAGRDVDLTFPAPRVRAVRGAHGPGPRERGAAEVDRMAFGVYGFVEPVRKWHRYVLNLLAGSVVMLAGDYATFNA